MSRSLPERRMLLRACGLALVAFVWALSPSAASAGCGDWLAGSHGPGDPSGPAGVDPSSGGQVPGGCHGPLCERRRSELPSVPPAPSPDAPTDRAAWVTGGPAVSGAERERLCRSDDAGEERFVPYRPDRPPRV